MHWFLSVLIAAAYCLACLGLGLLIMRSWERMKVVANRNAFPADISTTLACLFLAGVALYSMLLTALGLAGQLRLLPLVLMMLPGVAGLAMGRSIFGASVDAIYRVVSNWTQQPAWLLSIAVLSALLALSFGIGAWVLPPKGDAAAFYLVYPKIIASTGVLDRMPGPFNFFSTIGLPAELHYAALMVLADEHAAKLIMFPVALATGAILAAIVRRCGGGIIAVTMSWAMLLSSYAFYHHIFDGKVDLMAAAFGLAAVYWLLAGSIQKISVTSLAVAGWFGGLATVAKFSYFPVLGTSLAVLLAWRIGIDRSSDASARNATLKFVKAGAIMALAATIAWAPQLLKNAVLFDAPLAPFLGGPVGENWLNQVWFSPETTRKILFTYPFALVLGRYPMQGGGLSLLCLALLPLLLWLPRPSNWRISATTAITVAGLAAVAVWMLLRPSVIAPRYILASLLMLVPVLALAAENVLRQPATSRWLRGGIAASALTALAASFWHLLPIPSAVLAGWHGRQTECLLASAECQPLTYLAGVARPGDRILIATYYPYWLTPSHLQCRDTREEQASMPGRERLIAWLRARGFVYVAVDASVDDTLAADLQRLASSNAGVYELPGGPTLKVYRVDSNQPSVVRCVESDAGGWHLQEGSS